MSFVTRFLAVLVLASLCAVVFAQDWPQWRGPNRDGKVAGFVQPAAMPPTLTKGWQVKVGVGDAGPVLVGDKLYVFAGQGDQEVTLCLNAADGTQAWKDSYPAPPVTGPASRHAGPRGTPAVADGKVVTLGSSGTVSCLDAATGKVLWRKDEFPGVIPQFYTSMSPLVVDGLAIAQLGGKAQGGMLAFSLATGEVKWRWLDEGPEYASPVLLTAGGVKQLVTLTNKRVVGVAVADGALLWSLPFVPAMRAYNAATPLVAGDTVIYTGAQRGTHAVKIEKQGAAFTATAVWDNPDVAVQYNTPVLKDGLLFGLSDKGNVFCLDAKTGKTAWIDAAVTDRMGFCTLLDLGPALLALPSSGELIAFKPDATAYAELARLKVADTPTYAPPLVAGNRIFVKDMENLTVWGVK
jgi:outer membrane protein assembly factor BamB